MEAKLKKEQWRCIDRCCWMIGYTVTAYWLLIFALTAFASSSPAGSPGSRLRRQGLAAVHPVVMVPGIITHPLELWEGRPCADGLFRKRLSFAHLIARPLCSLQHLALCNRTGLDPPGIRVRAVSGLASPDYSLLVDNLSKIGYEEKSMFVAAYDWRLAFQNTEVRDQTLSRLKSQMELMYATNGGKKVVVVAYSTGALYFLHFLKWVEAGGGGPGWCNTHVKAVLNVEPAFLGDLSFIMRGLDSHFLGMKALQHVFNVVRTWDSIMSLMPKGGDTVWGSVENPSCILSWPAPTADAKVQGDEIPTEFHDNRRENRSTVIELLQSLAPELIQRADCHYSYGIAEDFDDPKYSHHKYWSNPLETRLPAAPDVEIYCLYGVDVPTERSSLCKGNRTKSYKWIDNLVNDEAICLKEGINFVDGDERVSVLSSGLMCSKGWRGRTRFNPSGAQTYVREYLLKLPRIMTKGRHVNIMGDVALIEDIIRVAAGSSGNEIGGDRIHSPLLQMAERINLRL